MSKVPMLRPVRRLPHTAVVILFLVATFWCYYALRATTRSFWIRESRGMFEVVEWIRENTDPTDRFMYATTPQDLAYFAGRQTVIDPNWHGPIGSRATGVGASPS